MSYELKIENKYGDQLTLTGNPNYNVKATGLNPVVSNIVTSPVANYGGERYKSSRQQKRNIVLTIYVKEPVEANRINLYGYIKSDDWIRVYFKNNSRNVYIDGYVESFELDHFAQTQTAQVSIICPLPNFIDMNSLEIDNGGVIKNFYFPFHTEVKSSKGKSLTFADTGDCVAKFSDFMAEGETTQIEYDGYQLIPYPYFRSSGYSNNGFTFIVNEDKSVTINGTMAEGETEAIFDLIYPYNPSTRKVAELNKVYELSDGTKPNDSAWVQYIRYNSDSKTYDYSFSTRSGDTTIQTNTSNLLEYGIRIMVGGANTTLTNYVIKPMLVEVAEDGSFPTEYEPYTGGVPVPNPDWTEEITGLGTLSNGAYCVHLDFDTAGRTKAVTIPLGKQIDGENLIKGGASLVNDDNYLITYTFVDSDGCMWIDEKGNVLFE